jgi:hypothetical protein
MRKLVTLVARVEGVLQQPFYIFGLRNLAKLFLDQFDHALWPFVHRPPISRLLSVVWVVGDSAL